MNMGSCNEIAAFLSLLFMGCAVTQAANSSVVKQDYPAKPVHIIEPFGLGGGPDLLARALATELSELWGQPVTVENHPGAGATGGPAQVAMSQPDGYTLLINTSAQAYSAAFLKNLPYEPLKDFIPVAALTSQPYVLVAGKKEGRPLRPRVGLNMSRISDSPSNLGQHLRCNNVAVIDDSP